MGVLRSGIPRAYSDLQLGTQIKRTFWVLRMRVEIHSDIGDVCAERVQSLRHFGLVPVPSPVPYLVSAGRIHVDLLGRAS